MSCQECAVLQPEYNNVFTCSTSQGEVSKLFPFPFIFIVFWWSVTFHKIKNNLWLQEPLKMMLVVVFPLLITKQTATKI